jgi:hypothetical protein
VDLPCLFGDRASTHNVISKNATNKNRIGYKEVDTRLYKARRTLLCVRFARGYPWDLSTIIITAPHTALSSGQAVAIEKAHKHAICGVIVISRGYLKAGKGKGLNLE